MNVPSKQISVYLFLAVMMLIFVTSWLQVLWADWAIRTIFHKDFNDLAIFASMCFIEIFCPKNLRGLTFIILILMTLYIFLV